MARVLYLDCFSGAAGDMLLGAMLDAGLPPDALRSALGSLGVGQTIDVTTVLRAGLTATRVAVRERDPHHEPGHSHPPGHSHVHAHAHAHAEHGHRTLAEIAAVIGGSSLSTAGKARAIALFQRIGEAEAAIHGTTLDRVYFHEVGALDSIIDIVGAVFAFEWFGIEHIVASPLNVGGGTVEIAHGTFPVPAPATLRLLAGVPVYSTGANEELVTPTGALLVSSYATSFGPMPPMTIERIGYGAGTRDPKDRPNVLRIVIGERAEATMNDSGMEAVLKIECDIDDMNPQIFAPAIERLHEAGALDVFLTPVLMKKGRPGTLVTVLAPPHRRESVCDVLFRETSTIGLRFARMDRETLERHWVDVAIDGGVVRVKVAGRHGEIFSAAPEFDDCLRIAQATGRPVKLVQADAFRAWHLATASRPDEA